MPRWMEVVNEGRREQKQEQKRERAEREREPWREPRREVPLLTRLKLMFRFRQGEEEMVLKLKRGGCQHQQRHQRWMRFLY